MKKTTTLVVFGESSPLGAALKRVNLPDSCIAIVTKPATSNHFLPGQVIATSLGTSFLYLDHEDALPQPFHSSFACLVCICNVAKLAQRPAGSLAELQRRAPMNSMFCMAYDAEEAAEFVLTLVAKLSDPKVREQAQQMSNNNKEETMDFTAKAFEVCEATFPIPQPETRALLESVGSIRELCGMRSSREMAQRSPLSNQHACAVAGLLGLEVVVPQTSATLNSSFDNIRRFF